MHRDGLVISESDGGYLHLISSILIPSLTAFACIVLEATHGCRKECDVQATKVAGC